MKPLSHKTSTTTKKQHKKATQFEKHFENITS